MLFQNQADSRMAASLGLDQQPGAVAAEQPGGSRGR